jgi:hypothetical protein
MRRPAAFLRAGTPRPLSGTPPRRVFCKRFNIKNNKEAGFQTSWKLGLWKLAVRGGMMSRQQMFFPNLIMAAALIFTSGLALAKSGPIVADREPDFYLDRFESETPALKMVPLSPQSKPNCAVERLATGGRFGKGCLRGTITMPANVGIDMRLVWKFEKPVDLSGYDEIVFFYKSDGAYYNRPAWHIITANGDRCERGAALSEYGDDIDPEKKGQWQCMRIKLNPDKVFWYFFPRSGTPGRHRANLADVAEIRLEFSAKARDDSQWVFQLDAPGFYKAQERSSATVRLWAPRGYWVEPGQNYLVEALVADLPPGKKAEVRVEAFDARGMAENRPQAVRRVAFTSSAGGIQAEPGPDNFYMRGGRPGRVEFPNEGSGFLHLAATLNVDGKDVWRDEIGMGCLRPFAGEDREPNESSIFGFWPSPPQKARELGAKWMRMRLGPTSVQHGAFNDKRMSADDGDIGQYSRPPDGLRVIALLGGPTKDLSSKPDAPNYGMRDPADWEKFAELWTPAIVWARDNGIRHFEVINEPFAGKYQGDLVKLHQEQYKLIHRLIPDARVLGPCPQGMLLNEIDKFLADGGNKGIDDMVVHAYARPDDLRAKLRELRKIMARHGMGDRDIYITEQGGTALLMREELSQAALVVQSYVVCLAEGVRVLLWHGLYDSRKPESEMAPVRNVFTHGFSLTRYDGMVSPAAVAYGAMASVLERAKYVDDLKGLPAGVQGYRFAKRGDEILVLWAAQGQSAEATVPVAGETTRRMDLYGRESALRQADGSVRLKVTDEPVYLISGKAVAGSAK